MTGFGLLFLHPNTPSTSLPAMEQLPVEKGYKGQPTAAFE